MYIRCPYCNFTAEIPMLTEGVTTKCRRCRRIFSGHRSLLAKPRAPRVSTSLPCRVADIPGRVINVSRTGLLIRLKKFFAAPAEVLTIELALPGRADPLRIKARLARIVDRQRTRLAFHILSVDDQEGFRRFLRLRGEATRIAAMVSP